MFNEHQEIILSTDDDDSIDAEDSSRITRSSIHGGDGKNQSLELSRRDKQNDCDYSPREHLKNALREASKQPVPDKEEESPSRKKPRRSTRISNIQKLEEKLTSPFQNAQQSRKEKTNTNIKTKNKEETVKSVPKLRLSQLLNENGTSNESEISEKTSENTFALQSEVPLNTNDTIQCEGQPESSSAHFRSSLNGNRPLAVQITHGGSGKKGLHEHQNSTTFSYNGNTTVKTFLHEMYNLPYQNFGTQFTYKDSSLYRNPTRYLAQEPNEALKAMYRRRTTVPMSTNINQSSESNNTVVNASNQHDFDEDEADGEVTVTFDSNYRFESQQSDYVNATPFSILKRRKNKCLPSMRNEKLADNTSQIPVANIEQSEPAVPNVDSLKSPFDSTISKEQNPIVAKITEGRPLELRDLLGHEDTDIIDCNNEEAFNSKSLFTPAKLVLSCDDVRSKQTSTEEFVALENENGDDEITFLGEFCASQQPSEISEIWDDSVRISVPKKSIAKEPNIVVKNIKPVQLATQKIFDNSVEEIVSGRLMEMLETLSTKEESANNVSKKTNCDSFVYCNLDIPSEVNLRTRQEQNPVSISLHELIAQIAQKSTGNSSSYKSPSVFVDRGCSPIRFDA